MKPIGVFVQFLKGLEGENDNRRKSFREAEGKSTVEFFATPTLRDCHTHRLPQTSFPREARFHSAQ